VYAPCPIWQALNPRGETPDLILLLIVVASISSFASKRPSNCKYNIRLVLLNLLSFKKRYFMLVISFNVNI
jgi:hypothetical protein